MPKGMFQTAKNEIYVPVGGEPWPVDQFEEALTEARAIPAVGVRFAVGSGERGLVVEGLGSQPLLLTDACRLLRIVAVPAILVFEDPTLVPAVMKAASELEQIAFASSRPKILHAVSHARAGSAVTALRLGTHSVGDPSLDGLLRKRHPTFVLSEQREWTSPLERCGRRVIMTVSAPDEQELADALAHHRVVAAVTPHIEVVRSLRSGWAPR